MINSQLDKLPRGEQVRVLSELIRRHAARIDTLGTIVLEHDRDFPEHLQ